MRLVIDVHFAFGPDRLSIFSVVSTIGTPIDITAQELRVDAFFPSDAATQKAWTCATELSRPVIAAVGSASVSVR